MRSTTYFGVLAMLTLSALFFSLSASAAPRLSPPSVSLCKGHHQVVVGKVTETQAESVAFQVEETLCGEEADKTFEVRMPNEAISQLDESEQTYILGFTRIRRNPLVRDVREVDPKGPRAIEVPYLGLALMEDAQPLRDLLAKSKKLSEKATLELLTSLMQGDNALHQRLAIAELQLRPELQGKVKRKTSDAVKQLLANPGLDPDLHDLLLQSSLKFPKKYQGAWLVESSRRVLDENGPELDLATPVPALLQTALLLLKDRGTSGDASLAAKHLASNNPGVVKAALSTANKLDAEIALTQVKKALQPVDMHTDSRRLLQDYLEKHSDQASQADT